MSTEETTMTDKELFTKTAEVAGKLSDLTEEHGFEVTSKAWSMVQDRYWFKRHAEEAKRYEGHAGQTTMCAEGPSSVM